MSKMTEKATELAARINRVRTEGLQSMWYMIFANTALDLLKTEPEVSLDRIIEEMEARKAASPDKFTEDAYEAAINAVRDWDHGDRVVTKA
ncbi:MAG: hypothetical protein AAF739_16975 [Pseudomonadota bacterium]